MLSFESSCSPESKIFILGALAGIARAGAARASAARAGAARAGASRAGASAARATKSLGGITISPSNQKTEDNSTTIINEK